MRINAYNPAPIIVAALVIYLVGFLIYGLIVDPQLWMAESGITQAQMDAVGAARMPFSPLMPIATAIGLAVLYRLTNRKGVACGVWLGVVVALTSAVPTIWYGWVYGVGGLAMPLIDSAHLLLGHAAAGAVIGWWK